MLPLEIIIRIAIKNAAAWHALLAIPNFGRFTLLKYGKRLANKAFGHIYIDEDISIYYMNGKIHRDDLPAMIYSDGSECWYLNDNLHRDGGPAINYANGYQAWYNNGALHREDGPAVIYENGKEMWYLNNKIYAINFN